MNFKDLTFKTKMLICFISATLVLMTAVMVVTTYVTKKGVTKTVDPFLQVFSHVTANAVEAGLEFNDNEAVEEALRELTRQEIFSYIRVWDQRGQEVFYFRKQGMKDVPPNDEAFFKDNPKEMVHKLPVQSNGQQIGSISIGVSLEELGKSLSFGRATIIVLSVVMIGLFVGIIYFMANWISKPLQEMTHIAREIAKGNLNHDIKIQRKDEIGLLANSFSIMITQLCELVSQVKSSSNDIALASDELSASSQQMSSSSEETEHQINSVSEASEQTNQNVQAVATAAEEMSATVKEISKSIQEGTRTTMHAVRLAETTNSSISKLDQSSGEIGEVIKVITSIAQQTNLLALNATIEAARAGEAGKGFAVVANEVKDLAKGTSKATEEIGQKIAAIQADTQGAITAIGEIGTVIGQISEISATIAGAVEEQATTTTEITRNMVEAASGTSQVVQSYTGMLAASKSAAAESSNVYEASQRLSKMGGDLLALVSRFK